MATTDEQPDSEIGAPAARPIDAQSTHPLRASVLRPGADPGELDFPGDDAPSTLHVGAFLGADLVSIGSIYHESRPEVAPGGAGARADHGAGTAWRLRGMATDPTARRSGAGRAALDLLIEHVRANRGTLVWCNARIGAVGFYEAAGWTVLGEQFELADIGAHYVMERLLVPPTSRA